MISELNDRSRRVFRHIVEAYVETGEPIGSRTLSRRLGMGLSPATIRNVMADLEDSGLLFSPHPSAGRLPTEAGLRLFVHAFLEVGRLSHGERASIDVQCQAVGRSVPEMLEEASRTLSGLSRCAGLVVSPKGERAMKHIEFVGLNPERALVVMVDEDGIVENRLIDLPRGLPYSALREASNYLNARLAGRTLPEARRSVERELVEQQSAIDRMTAKLVEQGLATWSEISDRDGVLIVRGQANLLEDVGALEDLEHIRDLFEALETQQSMLSLLEATSEGEGVQIYIGAENKLFSHTGCSLIVAPYQNSQERVVGAIGVIGPTRLNYARIVPMVDYTAKVVGRLLS